MPHPVFYFHLHRKPTYFSLSFLDFLFIYLCFSETKRFSYFLYKYKAFIYRIYMLEDRQEIVRYGQKTKEIKFRDVNEMLKRLT